jgi:hypothetical protein
MKKSVPGTRHRAGLRAEHAAATATSFASPEHDAMRRPQRRGIAVFRQELPDRSRSAAQGEAIREVVPDSSVAYAILPRETASGHDVDGGNESRTKSDPSERRGVR